MGTLRELNPSPAADALRPRPATATDLAAIHAIYAYHVLHGVASFEEVPPSLEEMHRRFAEITARGLPYLALELDGEVGAYGYCAPYRARSAYRYALEDSVYVRHDLARRGAGRAILRALVTRCAELGHRQLIAVIGDSANEPSIALHAQEGFLRVGTLRSVGFKFGRWLDSVIMQRPLGRGDATRPST